MTTVTDILRKLFKRTNDIPDMFDVIKDQLTVHVTRFTHEREEERQRQEQGEIQRRQQAQSVQQAKQAAPRQCSS